MNNERLFSWLIRGSLAAILLIWIGFYVFAGKDTPTENSEFHSVQEPNPRFVEAYEEEREMIEPLDPAQLREEEEQNEEMLDALELDELERDVSITVTDGEFRRRILNREVHEDSDSVFEENER